MQHESNSTFQQINYRFPLFGSVNRFIVNALLDVPFSIGLEQ